MKLPLIFEFQLYPFAFCLFLGDLFMVSAPLTYEEGDFFPKKAFDWGKCIRGLFYMEELMIRSCHGGGGGGSQNAFSSNLNTVNLKIFPNLG